MSENKADNQYDLVIIGGGLAGASLACALVDMPLKIAIVEAFEIHTEQQPSYDDRTVALSYGSRCIYEGMGLWQDFDKAAEAINTIHISNRGHFGVTRLTREQENVPALGYVIENKRLGEHLYSVIRSAENITLYCPAEINSIEQLTHQVSVEIMLSDQPHSFSAKLLVAADGNNSQVLRLLNIGNSRKDYQQVALITNVTPGKNHDNTAYERFTNSGPLAFLPMRGNRCSVVWTLKPRQAEDLYAMDETGFLEQLQQCFGYRLGRLQKAGSRQIYPLGLQSAAQLVQGRVAIMGNAAHSVHPVAGQGFNLALRDIALLTNLILDTTDKQGDIGGTALLQQYANQRQRDIQQIYRFTDALVTTFSNAITPLAHLRSLSLFLLDIMPDIKHQLAKQSMGLNIAAGNRMSRMSQRVRL